MTALSVNTLSERVIGACIEIHRALGPGLLESAYEECLCYELSQAGLAFERQRAIPVRYKQVLLNCGYRADLIVDDRLIVELKTVDAINNIHVAQLLTYLRLTDIGLGLVVNFNVATLRSGIKRVVSGTPDRDRNAQADHVVRPV